MREKGRLIMMMRLIALSAVLILAPPAWAIAAPHAGDAGHPGGEHGDVAHGGGEHWGDRHGPLDDHRGWPRYGWYGDPMYPYPEPAAPQYWYYCDSAGAYYPYVAECPEGWQPVVP
jgi:hypothetical protein